MTQVHSAPSAPAPAPWDRLPDEAPASHDRFRAFLELGPDRSLAAVARHHAVSREAVRQQSVRYRWSERAAAFDAARPAAALENLELLAPSAPPEREALDPALARELELFREEAQRLGQGQARLARGLTQAAARGAARILEVNTPLSPRDVAHLATTAAALANSGLQQWGRSIGVDVALRAAQGSIEAQAEVLPD